jgi:amino acid transporter
MPFDQQYKRSGPDAFESAPAKRLGLVSLVAVIFFTVSGGAYGLEPLVGAVGAGWAITLVLLVPLLWSLPIALMVAELASAMPEEGGYYRWACEGLGQFWGVQQGWFALSYSAVDMAIYPVLFVNYLAYFYPSLGLSPDGTATWGTLVIRWLIALAVIAGSLAVNWRGASAVGRNATVNTGLVLLPFALITIIGLARQGAPGAALATARDLGQHGSNSLLALGLSTVLWNYCGFDNVSTFAGEVDSPQRNYPRALALALPLIVAAYLLPLLAGIARTTDPGIWNESFGWPAIAREIGGNWLGIIVALAALCSAYSLFNSQLLYVSRLPYAMAREGWLPHVLARCSQATGMPTLALFACCAVSAGFAALPFGKLIVLDILLYSGSLSMQFAALMVLRRKRPEMARPFRIPGGWAVIFLAVLAPMFLSAIVLATSLSGEGSDPRQALIVAGIAATGVIIYFTRREAVKKRAAGQARTSDPN